MGRMTDDVPWLDDDELRDWMAFAAMLHTLPTALDAQLKADAGINLFEYHVLAALSEAPGRSMQLSKLAVFAQGSLSRLSHAVSRLEKAGWVERRSCAGTPRSTEAHLTAAGMRKIKQAAPGHVREVRRLVLDPLSGADAAELGRLARSILAATSPEVAAEVASRT